MKFRKRAVLVDAVLVSELIHCAGHNWKGLPEWVRALYGSKEPGVGIVFAVDCVFIKTRLFDITAGLSDWLIRDEQGDISTCSAGMFAARYEPDEPPDNMWPIGTSAGGV